MISYLRGNILDAVINIACIALPNAVMSGAKELGKTCKSAGEFVSKLSKEARGMVKAIASSITGIRDAIGKVLWLLGEKIIRPIMDKLDKFADKVKSIFSEATEKEAKDKAAKETVSKGTSEAGKNIIDKANINGKRIGDMNKQEIIDGIPDGWEIHNNNGFVHIKDEYGKTKIEIHKPDKVTNYEHIHIYDDAGNPLDINGVPGFYKDEIVHIPLKK